MPSIYETINQRANDIIQTRWQQYIPLTSFQLTDYDAQADEERDNEDITIIGMTADRNPNLRSTRRSVVRYKQFKVIKRPTEILAIMRANTCPDDSPVIRIEPVEELRWCIRCRYRHEMSNFKYNSKRYLHGYSYACKKSLGEERIRIWRKTT